MKLLAWVFAAWLLYSCSDGHDSDYIPYRLDGFDSYVYVGGKEFYAGRSDANYWSREKGLAQCQANARYLAQSKHFQDWGYVCCTVSGDSTCKTKVR